MHVIKRSLTYLIPIVIALSAIFATYKLWGFFVNGSWTRDGRFSAEIVNVSSEVSGRLISLGISDNMYVKKGQLLAEIDERDYINNLRMQEAKLQEATLQRENVDMQYKRRLHAEIGFSKEEVDNLRVQRAALDANIIQIETAIEQVKLNLSRTKIYAPANGFITNLQLREGNYIPVGQAMFALVDSDSFHVIAYFEETKMPHIKLGKRVSIIPYSGGEEFEGVITGYGRAIVDQSSHTGEQLVRNVQPTYPWVRLAQRIPVRIAIDDSKQKELGKTLVSGTTCTVKIIE